MAALFVVAGLAGCAEGPGPAVPIQVADVAPFAGIMQERPVLASVMIHEEPEGPALDLDLFGAKREPHDGQLSYHGLAEVHDEWGRLVPAHVFRYNPMVFVTTDIQITAGVVVTDGEYQERHWELYFDAADGRMMGLTDLDTETRSFADPDTRLPFGPDYTRNLLLWMVAYMEGDLTAPVAQTWGGRETTYWLEPFTGERPLPGSCNMYIARTAADGETRADKGSDPYRSIACFDHSMIPLWHWAGNKSQGSFSLERRGPGFAWAGPMGEKLAPEPFSTAPLERIEPLLPAADPIFVPPSDTGEDWATEVRKRVEALHYSIPYREFEITHGPTYAHEVITGWPPHTLHPVLAGLGNELAEAAEFEETSWVMVTEEVEEGDWLWTFVHTVRDGEGQRHFVPDQQGWTFESGPFGYPTMEELGDVVETTSIRGRIQELAPSRPNFIDWMVWPEFDSEFTPVAWWTVANLCWEAGEVPGFLLFDGKDGHLISARTTASEDPCAIDGFHSWLGSEEVTVFPATPDRPFPIVLDGSGGLAMPLPPQAAQWLDVPLI